MRALLFLSAFVFSLTAIAQADFESSEFISQDTSVDTVEAMKVSIKVNFGNHTVGVVTAPTTYFFKNCTPDNIQLKKVKFKSNGFYADTSGCPATIGVGQTCTVSIAFNPKKLGPAEGKLELDFDGWPDYEYNLSGVGVP